jgi:3-hydroxyisobutyrate dehydrogenase-like beta-hydroxyacid dehydrogenase
MQDWNRANAVGVVGVGVMGGGMAANVLEKGHDLVAHDVDGARLEAMAQRGARVAASLREVAELARIQICMVQTTTVALAEAFALGAKAGLDPDTIYQVLRVSTGASAILEMRAPRFLSGDWTPGGTVDINYKDQELETAFAKDLGVPMLMANVSQQVFKMGQAAGLGKLDSASLITLYEQWADVQVGERTA